MTVGLWLLAAAVVAGAPTEKNPVYDLVTIDGVFVGGKEPVRLPAPVMADGLDAKAQQKALIEIVGANALQQFLKKSALAPQVVKTRELKGDEGRGQVVSVSFVAYGTLDQFFDKHFRDQLLNSEDDGDLAGKGGALDAEQLKQRGISWSEADREIEAYSHGSVTLLKKVKSAGVVRTYSSRSKESVIFAAMVDPRFKSDREFPNNWAPITRTATGGEKIGEPRPYAGMGAYMKATKLAAPAGAILVECRVVFSEPKEWFDGANLLGAKIPAIAQSRVRSIRRELAVSDKPATKK